MIAFVAVATLAPAYRASAEQSRAQSLPDAPHAPLAAAYSDFDGDGYGDLAAGSYDEVIGSAQDAGAVSVLYGDALGLLGTGDQFWHQNTLGVQDTAELNDGLGRALAAGNYNGDLFADLAIGVFDEGVGAAPTAGAVHVLYGESAGLQLSPSQQFLTQNFIDGGGEELLDVPDEADNFGRALAAGDFDGDGFDDLAVGVMREDTDADIADAGAVAVLYGSSNGLQAGGAVGGRDDQLWDQDDTDVDDMAEDGDHLGMVLASGDFNNDTFADLAIGAFDEDIGAETNAGGVNVLYGSGTEGLRASEDPDPQADDFWSQDYPQLEETAEQGDLFGRDLATGKFNDDSFADLAIGAWQEDLGAGNTFTDAGVVHILYGATNGLQVTSPADQLFSQGLGVKGDREAFDFFGQNLAAGRFNSGSFGDLAIGAFGEDSGATENTNEGAVNVLYGSAGGLQDGSSGPEDQFWVQGGLDPTDGIGRVNDNDELNDQFGKGLGAANFNDDGFTDLAIGAWGEMIVDLIRESGSANVLYGSTLGLQATDPDPLDPLDDDFWHQGNTSNPDMENDPEAFDRFGFSLR